MQSIFATDVIKIRDDGQTYEPAVYELDDAGKPTLNPETNQPILVKDEVPGRDAWPEGHAILLRSTLRSGDYELSQKLQADVNLSFNPATGAAMPTAKIKIYLPALIYPAILVEGFEGEAFVDPETGAPMQVPEGIEQRLDLMRRLPMPILNYLNGRIMEVAANPFGSAGTESSTKPASESGSMKSSGSSGRRTGKQAS